MSEIETAIIKALAYAAVFNFPLTRVEITKYLEIEVELKTLLIALEQLQRKKLIGKKGDYYFLAGREKVAAIREKRAEVAKNKWKKAREIGKKLSRVKAIEAILVTGTLSVNNTDEYDDIDLMIITQENRLWSCRLAITFWLEWWRERRRPEGKIANGICVNFYLDRSALEIPESRRSLFTAHEMVQATPILNRNQAYQDFQNHNGWVSEYLPQGWKRKKLFKIGRKTQKVRGLSERIAYLIQKIYMQPRITNERVNHHEAWFHPGNTPKRVLFEYDKILKPMLTTKIKDGKRGRD